jgi:hypothetical protein
MKNLKIGVLLVMAVAFLTSPVLAQTAPDSSYIDITEKRSWDIDVDAEPSGPVVVGQEWLQDLNDDYGPDFLFRVDLGDAQPRPCVATEKRSNLIYVPELDILNETTLVFKVCGGLIETDGHPNYTLYDLKDSRPVAELVDVIDPDESADGCQLLKFHFNICCSQDGTDVVKQGHRLALTENNNPPRIKNRPTLLFNWESLNANGGQMTIEVSEALIGATELGSPLTGQETLVKLFDKDQLYARVEYRNGGSYQSRMVEGFATATIDIYADPSRAKFEDEGRDTRVDTGETTSTKAEILVVDAGYNGGIIVDGEKYGWVNYGFEICNAEYRMEVHGPYQAGIEKIEVNTIDNGTIGYADDFTPDGAPWTYWWLMSQFSRNDLREALQNDVRITVFGDIALDPALYRVNLEVTPTETGLPILLLDKDASDTSSHAFHWAINGQQVRIPYILIEKDGNNFTSWISITNHMNQKAEVFAKAIVSSEDGSINEKLEFSHAIMTLEPHSVTLLRENEIADLIGPTVDTGIWRCAVTLYIATEDDLSDVTAWQISPDGRCQIPVYYDLKAPFFRGRDWVQ